MVPSIFFIPLEFSINLHTIKIGLSILHIEGSQITFFFRKAIAFLSLKINIVSANSADSDKIPHYVAFHLGRHCLPKYMLSGFQSTLGNLLIFILSNTNNMNIITTEIL